MTSEFSDTSGTELVVVSAADEASLVSEMRRLVAFLDRVPDVNFLDVAYTASLTTGPSRIAMIADGVPSLRARLASAVSRLESGAMRRLKDKSGTYYFRDHLLSEGGGRLAFVYPGVMSFYPDMMRDLAVLHPECRGAFDELEEAMAGIDDEFTPSNFIFPPAPYYRHDADVFSSGAYAQALVATFAGSAAMSRLLADCSIAPDAVVGCAGGDLASVMHSGAAGERPPRQDRVRFIREIYKIVDKAVDHEGLPKTAMISVLMRHEGDADAVVAAFPKGMAMLAMDLSPRQRTYAVQPEFADEALRAFADAGIRAVRNALDRPFNTPWCARIVPAIRKFTGDWIRNEPKCDVYSCGTAERLSRKPRHARNDTAERWASTVRFADTIRKMHEDGVRVFLEVGPRGLMTSAMSDILGDAEYAAIATNSIHRRGRLQFQHALAQLVALGAEATISQLYARRGAKRLDFDSAVSLESREVSEMALSRLFPKLSLLGDDKDVPGAVYLAEAKGRGARAAQRAAVMAERKRRRQQFDFGAAFPLISDADEVSSSPGFFYEITKTFRLDTELFMGDASYGASQLSYSDKTLRGLVVLSIPVAAEIMAETALRLMPNRTLVAIEDFNCRGRVQFVKGRLKLFVKAERVASADSGTEAVKVQIRDDSPNSQYTWPVMEATFILARSIPESSPASVDGISKPRSVHWSGREIYPAKLGFGERLRGITFAETWGEDGLDYEIKVPPLAGSVTYSRFPLWVVNPLLLQIVVSGFMLWRCNEKFRGAFSFPFRMRRLDIRAPLPKEDTLLNCYLRLTGVTPNSQLCDITVTGGDGNVVMEIVGWEEITERVSQSLCDMVLQPAQSFATQTISREMLGDPATDVASAYITDVPYKLFERNEELWLKILSHIVLNAPERKEFLEMKGSTSRRTEWLYGRIAAKEAVRRYMKTFYQARWSYADVQIWRSESGKPIAIGEWRNFLKTKFDIAIAHTAQFVVAVTAANAKVGVDVESVARDLSSEFTKGVFTDDELDLAAEAPNASQAIIRFWCAKEAVSKALGTGIRYSPREMRISGYQADTGTILVRLEGAWEAAFKTFRGRDIKVASRVMRDHALAFCFIPVALFPDEETSGV